MALTALLVLGVACTVIAFSLSTIIPLRIFAMAGNAVSIIYGWFMHDPLLLAEGAVLLPLNGLRLGQMLRLIQRTRRAAHTDLSMDWLMQYGRTESFEAGDIVFEKDDEAHELYYVESGHFGLIESGIEIEPHTLVGELGLFSPGQRRTQGLACIESGRMLRVSYTQLMQLYYQNPQFGFYLLRLISERLMDNAKRAQAEADRLRQAAADRASEAGA